MAAKFLVVEVDDNHSAVELVQMMLERGFARLMLLDDLGKHPALNSSRSNQENEGSILTEPSTPSNSEPTDNTSIALKDIMNKRERSPSLEKDHLHLNHGSPTADELPMCNSESATNDLLSFLQFAAPEMINVAIKEEKPEPNDGCDAEDFNFDFGSAHSHLDLLAQARCLVGSPGTSESLFGGSGQPLAKRAKTTDVDPDKDYHRCRLCGTRVKAPRGGRWNLQMHIMAMHTSLRPYKCQQCDFQDYRKPGMRKHCIITHGQDMDPVDISTDEKRKEWDAVMGRCFPEFAYRTGFLMEPKKDVPLSLTV